MPRREGLAAPHTFASLRDAQRHLARSAAHCEPNAARAAFYRPLFALYQQAHRALAPISHELAALPANRAAPQAA